MRPSVGLSDVVPPACSTSICLFLLWATKCMIAFDTDPCSPPPWEPFSGAASVSELGEAESSVTYDVAAAAAACMASDICFSSEAFCASYSSFSIEAMSRLRLVSVSPFLNNLISFSTIFSAFRCCFFDRKVFSLTCLQNHLFLTLDY